MKLIKSMAVGGASLLAVALSAAPAGAAAAWDCAAGYSCYYNGTDGRDKLFTAARCGTHDLRGGPFQDKISSIANYGSGKVWVYVWDVEAGDHFDLHGWVEVGSQGNFYTNDIDKIHIDC
ncbi:peptidase inhibitor family I36 protein [Actinosynnema sp. NPDC023587]|uniref:peptidase inhibitor family I36 protein n=1 Tax=Actinosynnema sp. NPDC023587 TaxID=3154695 RepID=UPI0033F42231